MKERIEVGATVEATDGRVGIVETVVTDPDTGTPDVLMIRGQSGASFEVPTGLVDGRSTAREVYLTAPLATLSESATVVRTETGQLAAGDRLIVPIREEVLVPTTRPVDLGAVRVHTRTETVPVEATVDVARDQVAVERVKVDRTVDAMPEPRYEGETLIVPVIEEVLITEKRLILREEIRITRRRVSEPVTVRETVRHEVIELEDPTGERVRVAGGKVDRVKTASPETAGAAGDLPLS